MSKRSKTRLYRTYRGMLDRCNNPHTKAYPRYGGRGITVCAEWKESFDSFAAWALSHGYDEALPGKFNSLDRIDPDGDYSPENCRWIPMSQQAANKSRVVRLTFNGVTHTLPEWAEITGIPYDTLHARYHRYHWSAEDTLTRPVGLEQEHRMADGTRCTVSQIAQQAGIPYYLAYTRLKYTSWTPDEIAAGASRDTQFAYRSTDGTMYTLSQIAEQAGVSRQTAWHRLHDLGWSVEQALHTPQRTVETYTDSNGRTYTISELASITAQPPTTLRSRLKSLHWTVDECLAGHRFKNTDSKEYA